MDRWLKRHSLLLLIVILGLSLRLIHFREWFHFEMDEEVVAWRTRQFWQLGKPFLIGGGTPFGLHLGPAFYYLSSIPLWLTQGDPMSWGWLAALVGILTIVLCYYVGTLLYSQRVGIMVALLWSTSFIATMSDRHWWPLVLDPLLSLLSLLSLFRILRGAKRWWIYWGFILAFAWQTDLTVLPLFLAAIVVGILRFKKEAKSIGICVIIVLASFFPLAVFEIRHPGVNVGKLFSHQFQNNVSISQATVWSSLKAIPLSLSKLLFPGGQDTNLSRVYSWCKEIVLSSQGQVSSWALLIAALITLFPVFRIFQKSERKTSDKLLVLFFTAGIGGFLLFRLSGGNSFDFYLAALYPIFLLSASVILATLWDAHKVMAMAIIAGIVSLNISAFLSARHPYGLEVKQEAVSWAADMLSGKSFALESFSGCNRYNGIRYLFLLKKREPVMSFMDPNLFWLYDEPPAAEYPDYVVVIVTPSDLTANERKRYNEITRNVVSRKTFGELEVSIVNNEKRQFSIDF